MTMLYALILFVCLPNCFAVPRPFPGDGWTKAQCEAEGAAAVKSGLAADYVCRPVNMRGDQDA
jgi:hypothetical protein